MKNRIALLLSCLLLHSCSGGSDAPPPAKNLGRFQQAGDCAAVKSYAQGFVDKAKSYSGRAVPVAEAAPAAAPNADAGAETAATPAGTVLQSDLAFADAERGLLYVFAGSRLKILQASPAAEARVLGEIELDFPPQELLSLKVAGRHYAAIFGGHSYGGIEPLPFPATDLAASFPVGEERVVMALFDLSQPDEPKRLLQESAPGRFLEARALTQAGKVVWVGERHIYLGEKIEDELLFPEKTVLRDGVEHRLPWVGCADTLLYQNESLDEDYVPYSLTATTISLLDLSQAALPRNSQAILSPAWRTLIAANAEHLLLAQNVDGPARSDTELYRFALGGAAPLAFLDAAQVPGQVLNQFFLDEKDGVLRVFHHLPQAFGPCPGCGVAEPGVVDGAPGALKAQSASAALEIGNYLSTYRNGLLLGRSGPFEADEVPYAARFLGDLGCVITFLQIDPLTCFDLKNPARPLRLGELEIEGVSFHLEDLGQGHLLGVGQDAWGRVVANLFDIRNPAQPQLAHQLALSEGGWAWSPVFHDFRALAQDATARLFAVPVEQESGSKLALFSVDLAAQKFQTEGSLFKLHSPQAWEYFLRAYFFPDSLGTLSSRQAELFHRGDLAPLLALPLEN